jgi:hypothetical protein
MFPCAKCRRALALGEAGWSEAGGLGFSGKAECNAARLPRQTHSRVNFC